MIAAMLELGGRVVASRHVTVPPDLESAVAAQHADPASDKTASWDKTVDPADLGGLFDRHGAELLRYCARRVGPDHAEDVVAETFLTAYAQRERFDPARASPVPWL